ncbi:MAG TPA: hypothetical protein VLA66_11710, partial [Thermoanaerobaculia bacterium]|nr:hypothetical protein [Thermoanaerobaculia bacterium]
MARPRRPLRHPGEGGAGRHPAPARAEPRHLGHLRALKAVRHPALWAIAGGAAWGVCHLALPAPWLSLVALAPLYLLLGVRRAGWWGWLHGIASWSVAVWWIVPTVTVYGMLPGWLGALALLLLAAILGSYHALFAALGARLWRSGRRLDLLALPALWVALEWVRAWALSGFPWNLAAHAWTEVPGALALSSWIGAYGVSALVVTPALGLARSAVTRRWEPAAIALLVPLIVLAVAARFAAPGEAERAPVAVA